MKQIIFGMAAGCIVILCAVAILTVEGKSSRENELKHALSAAVEETMENLCTTQKYTVENQEEFIADFCQSLLQRIHVGTEESRDENLAVEVNVTGVDLEKGLLSVAVTETFTYPNGNIGEIHCSSTAILEQEAERKEVVLTYYLGDRIYRQFGLLEKDDFKVPQDPVTDDGTFAYWRDLDTGERAVFPEKATVNKSYVAVFY